jgi:parvulin-like peptidyl-prolyl isomerase
LRAGEPFGVVAAAVSQDQDSNNNGGDLGWIGTYVKGPSTYTASAEFMDVIQNGEVGAVIGPIDTTTNGPTFGYHIIQIMAREVRTLTNDQSADAQAQRFALWLNEQKANYNAQTYSTWFDWVPEDPTLESMGIRQF